MGQKIVSITIEGDKAVRASIRKALAVVDDLRIPFDSIAKDFYKRNRIPLNLKGPGQYEDFKNEESREGKIRAVGFDYPLLVRTTRLKFSLLNSGHPDAINIIGKREMFLGTSVPYYVHHHFGTRNMAQRPLVFIDSGPKETPGRREQWIKIIDDYISQKTQQVFKE